MAHTHRIHHLAVAVALAFALLAGPAAAAPPAGDPPVPASQYNARWPREPVGGPQPTVVAPATPTDGRDWTLVSVAAGFLLLAACTAVATGVRPQARRRVTA